MKLLEINEFSHVRIDQISDIEINTYNNVFNLHVNLLNRQQKIIKFPNLDALKKNYNNVLTMIKNCDKVITEVKKENE